MTNSPLVPDDLLDLLTTDHIGHVSSLRTDGSIVACPMWIDWDGEHLLTSSPVGSRKGARWRRDPRATVSVVDHFDDWRFVVIRGRVTEIRPDVDLEFIDRMARRYVGSTYRRRDAQREVFVITPDHIESGTGGWAPRRR
jgi:PPOX class probable F420-dependent enzyme